MERLQELFRLLLRGMVSFNSVETAILVRFASSEEMTPEQLSGMLDKAKLADNLWRYCELAVKFQLSGVSEEERGFLYSRNRGNEALWNPDLTSNREIGRQYASRALEVAGKYFEKEDVDYVRERLVDILERRHIN